MTTYGADYSESRDGKRLGKQRERVRRTALGLGWFTLDEIQTLLTRRFPDGRFPEASVLRQLRYLRAQENGGYTLEKRYEGNGLYKYRLLPPPVLRPVQAALFEGAR